uniref:Ataxin 7-like 3B n=1 Tax=Pan troglodytes TaxID=9598 RepID=K7CHC1_PANTR
MFSYLILCPSRGSSLICLAWPCVPPVPCSTAYLVPQVLLATPAVTLNSFNSALNAPASEACPISFFLPSVFFFFSFFFPCFCRRLRGESFLWLPLLGLELEENLIFCI